jgi:excisionase family DNA binding protein
VLNLLLQSRYARSLKQSKHPIANSGDLENRPFRPGVNMKLADFLEKRTTALTVSDAAEVLNISVRQVYSLVASNKIPHIKIGGSIRFDPSEFATWVRQNMITAIISSTSRSHQRPHAAVSRLSRTTIRTPEPSPLGEMPTRPLSRPRPSHRAKPAAQQQYRLFG